MRQLLAAARTVRCERRTYFLSARSEFMAAGYGPMLKAFDAVGEGGRDDLAADIEAPAERYNRGAAEALKLECDWLAVVVDR